MKEGFLFLYENMQLGGIETNLIDMIQIYHQQKRRIIWLRYGIESDIFEQWKDVLQACEVEIVATQISSQCWFQHENISFQASGRRVFLQSLKDYNSSQAAYFQILSILRI